MTDYDDLPRNEAGDLLADQVVFPVGYKLISPITVDGAELTAISVREPTVRDMEAAYQEKGDLVRSRRMLSLLVDMTPENVRDLGTRDFGRLSGLVAAFL